MADVHVDLAGGAVVVPKMTEAAFCPATLPEARAWLRARARARAKSRRWQIFDPGPNFWKAASTIGIFSPRPEWDEPRAFPASLSQKRLAYPNFSQGGGMSFHAVSHSDLRPHPLFPAVLEAPAEAPLIVPELLLVPAAALDRDGHRLGRGGGFYDRYLSQHPRIFRCGVVFSEDFFNRFPPALVQAHDEPLDAVLTERELHFIAPSRHSKENPSS